MRLCSIIKIIHLEKNIKKRCPKRGTNRVLINGKEIWYCDEHKSVGEFTQALYKEKKS